MESQMETKLKNKKIRDVKADILSKYQNEKENLDFINSLGILPNLPKEIIEYILQFLITTTDYIDYYIEKMYNLQENILDPEIFPYMLEIHNNSNKEEICKTWDYGQEFLLISDRHCNENSFYNYNNTWENSFTIDFKIQVECISKPRYLIENKKLLEYLLPINKILRIDYKCGMFGSPIMWKRDLEPYFQNILDAKDEDQTAILNIWNADYAKAFRLSIIDHNQGDSRYFTRHPEDSYKFVIDFMMYHYH